MSENSPENTEKKTASGFFTWISNWIKANPLWAAAHTLNFFAAIFLYASKNNDTHILPVVIFLCIIFVQVYTDRIEPLPTAESDLDERKKIEDKRSRQRNKWMIFAYSFMLISLLLTFYPFISPLFSFAEKTPGNSDGIAQQESAEQEQKKSQEGRYLSTLRARPIAVFVGCSLDPHAKVLLCEPEAEAGAGHKPLPAAGDSAKAQKQESGAVGSAWVINIGGHIKACALEEDNVFGKSVSCQVKDGLLIPLYFIILALMGGSISLTRRLPELQKQAGSEHIATEQQPKLTQYEFREHLIFQMVQYISAPLLAILAYYLIEPGNITNSVVLAFTAGFASETILLMVRSIANKITPGSGEALQYGAIAGVITIQGAAAKKAEVFLTELPQIHSITDEQGFYVLSNVPVGEHSISVKSGGTEATLKKDTVKIDRAQAIVKKNMAITAQDGGQK